jgi:hypothetical protein
MGGKTKKSKQKTIMTTKTAKAKLGKPAFFGRSKQEKLFIEVGKILEKRLKSPLTSPGFAQGRDFLSRRTEGLKRNVRGAPNIFAGLRQGSLRDIESAETRSLSDLIFQIQQSAIQDARSYATTPIPRGGVVSASSGQISTSQPGVTTGDLGRQIFLPTWGEIGGGGGVASLIGRGGGGVGGINVASAAF